MSVTVLVDVGPVAVDLDPVFGVLAVVPVAFSAVDSLIAGARGIPLVESLGAPILIRVAGAVLVVSVAPSRVVGKGGLVVGLRGISLPLVQTLGTPVLKRVAGTILVVSVATSRVVGKSRGVAIAGLSLPLVKTLGRSVLVGITRTVLVVTIAAGRMEG